MNTMEDRSSSQAESVDTDTCCRDCMDLNSKERTEGEK